MQQENSSYNSTLVHLKTQLKKIGRSQDSKLFLLPFKFFKPISAVCKNDHYRSQYKYSETDSIVNKEGNRCLFKHEGIIARICETTIAPWAAQEEKGHKP